jgi:hypothetical protein
MSLNKQKGPLHSLRKKDKMKKGMLEYNPLKRNPSHESSIPCIKKHRKKKKKNAKERENGNVKLKLN